MCTVRGSSLLIFSLEVENNKQASDKKWTGNKSAFLPDTGSWTDPQTHTDAHKSSLTICTFWNGTTTRSQLAVLQPVAHCCWLPLCHSTNLTSKYNSTSPSNNQPQCCCHWHAIDYDFSFVLNKVASSSLQVVNTHSPGKKVWLSGLAPAWAGGTSNLSDTYAAGFLWVQQRIFMRRANSCEFYWQTVTVASVCLSHWMLLCSEISNLE